MSWYPIKLFFNFKMMRCFFILAFLSFAPTVNAQFFDNHFVYISGGYTGVNYFGGRLALNYVYKEKFSAQWGTSGMVRKAARPDDYQHGLFNFLIFPSLVLPLDELESQELLVGFIHKVDKHGVIRFNLKSGVALFKTTEPYNWQRIEGSSFLVENYTYDFKVERHLGLVLRPAVEVNSRIFGISVSPYVFMMKERSLVGLEVSCMVGILRKKITDH